MNNIKILIVIRGASGSYKTTLANKLAEHFDSVICSADHHFIDENGKYNFQIEQLGMAHKRCQNFTEFYMVANNPLIVIDNTNTTWKEIKPYVKLAARYNYEVMILEPNSPHRYSAEECNKKNIHGVPLETIQKQLARFEPHESILLKIQETLANEK